MKVEQATSDTLFELTAIRSYRSVKSIPLIFTRGEYGYEVILRVEGEEYTLNGPEAIKAIKALMWDKGKEEKEG